MAQGLSLKMKDGEEKIMEGVLQFYYDIMGRKGHQHLAVKVKQ